MFSIVDGAGGLVSIDSDPAWGTRVTVQLPVREPGSTERSLAVTITSVQEASPASA